jgi:hypothetical protein
MVSMKFRGYGIPPNLLLPSFQTSVCSALNCAELTEVRVSRNSKFICFSRVAHEQVLKHLHVLVLEMKI